MITTNQITSDGILRTWKTDPRTGKVVMKTERVELTPERKLQLQRVEERVRLGHEKIDREIESRYQAALYLQRLKQGRAID